MKRDKHLDWAAGEHLGLSLSLCLLVQSRYCVEY
jgi:hypothetical protein